MNLNKDLPKGTASLIVSVIFLIIGLLLLTSGLASTKTDDGSGLGNFIGQTTIFVAVIAFLISIVLFFVSRSTKN